MKKGAYSAPLNYQAILMTTFPNAPWRNARRLHVPVQMDRHQHWARVYNATLPAVTDVADSKEVKANAGAKVPAAIFYMS
jgi:hypothetical protein